MRKFRWFLIRVIICIFFCSLLSVSHHSFLRVRTDGLYGHKQAINYKTAYRNRNIASINYNDYPKDTALIHGSTHEIGGNRNRSKDLQSVFDQKLTIGTIKNRNRTNSNKIALNDIFISVKTSKKFHGTRLKIILDTWFQQARNQTFFFTDADDSSLTETTDGHMINTGCSSSHTRRDLSCKMSAEYDGFVDSNKKWWCHFDDDNYVNVAQLVALLSHYDWNKDIYLGKPSLLEPFSVFYKGKKEEFWFATGGAGVCISLSLARKMAPWSRYGELAKTSKALRIPDDCTVGFIVSNRLGLKMTTSDLLHSHLENLHNVKLSSIGKQVTLSYKLNENNVNNNLLNLPDSVLIQKEDPTRILSIHCFLHPTAKICR